MNKQTITFTASEQTLTKTGGIEHYASNTVSYVQAIFDLGENWAGFDSVRAVFKTPYKTKPAVLDHSGRCLVPFEVLKYKCKVFVNLVGSISEEGVLTDRLTSYPIEALTIDANASVDNSETAISPTEFEEFVAIVSDDADRAEAGATASEASANSAEASAESALASAQASEASAIRASNSASDASASAQTAQEEAQKITGMVVVVTQLPEGATPTSDWSDGVLTIGIPKGDTGATGATGNGIESAVLNANYTLTLTFTDGTSYTTPSIRGATGATGATGNGISSVTLTSTSGAVKTYTIAFTDGTNTTFDVTDGEVTQAVLDETVADLKSELANEGVVQGSQGLVSDSKISDSVPYLFRQTADGQRVGNVLYEEIVGGTVAWNQLVQDPLLTDSSKVTSRLSTATLSDGIATVVPKSAGTERGAGFKLGAYVANHKYLFSADVKTTLAGSIKVGLGGGWSVARAITANTWTRISAIVVPSEAGTNGFASFYQANSLSTSDSIQYKLPQAFDLTQMFGTTIADHLYSLETATAGAGVAVFRKMFPNSYYPYNAGELKSVEGLTSHDTTEFNWFDKSTAIDNKKRASGTGEDYYNSAWAMSDYIRVIPHTTYYCNADGTGQDYPITFYDANKAYIGRPNIVSAGTFNTNDAQYVVLSTIKARTSIDDLILNISSDRNGQYEPYQKRTYALDSTLTLRGMPKLSDGKIYYDGDTYDADGTVTRKYGIVDMGTLSWQKVTPAGETFFQSSNLIGRIKPPADSSAYANCMSTAFTVVNWNSSARASGLIAVAGTGDTAAGKISCQYSSASTADDFKAAMSGVMLVYELATPTTETAEPYTSPQIVDRLGTEEYVTTGIVPVGHNSKYSEDLKGKLEGLPWDFSSLIAPTETTNKASRNYTSGSLLIMNNVLYKVTANIQSGGTITPNTNVTATTLSEVIANL